MEIVALPVNNLALIIIFIVLDKKMNSITYTHILIWWRDLADGLRYLHKKGIMHRGIMLENVLLFDSCRTAKISDFGHAKEIHHSSNIPLKDLPHGPLELLQGKLFKFFYLVSCQQYIFH